MCFEDSILPFEAAKLDASLFSPEHNNKEKYILYVVALGMEACLV
jgi:hypothetical protein